MVFDWIVNKLSQGGPLNKLWVIYVGVGAFLFGFFSIPSEGAAIVLIPMFFASGLVILYGAFLAARQDNLLHSRRVTTVGLAMMTVSGLARSSSLFGINQDGAGNNFVASVAWLWIAIGLAMLVISVWSRGMH